MKPYFKQPYDKFLSELLDCSDLIPNTRLKNIPMIEKSVWIITLSDQVIQKFRQRKQRIMPDASNCQFVRALLMVSACSRIHSKHLLPENNYLKNPKLPEFIGMNPKLTEFIGMNQKKLIEMEQGKPEEMLKNNQKRKWDAPESKEKRKISVIDISNLI